MTTHTVPAADGAAGWHRTPVNVTLSAADDGECVSGVDKTEFRVGSGAFAAYTAPVAITADGTHVVEYRSTDKAGNAETAKSDHGQARRHGADHGRLGRPDRRGPGDADAERDGPGVGCGAHGVPRRRWRVDDLRRGEQAGLHGQRHVRDRVPLHGRRRQRRDAEDGERHGRYGRGRHRPRRSPTPRSTRPSPVPAGPTPGPVTVRFAAADPVPANTVDVDANGTFWTPSAVSLSAGDTVRGASAPPPAAPHDVKLRSPGAAGASTQLETLTRSRRRTARRSPSRSTQTGTWTFICTLHSTYNAVADTWTGMVGTAVVAPGRPAAWTTPSPASTAGPGARARA